MTNETESQNEKLTDSQIAELFRTLVAESQTQTSVVHPESTVRSLKALLQALG